MGMYNISVCMAVYNGARYLDEQVSSILAQLRDNDELIIVDDGSDDESVAILEGFHDRRISIFCNASNLGVVKTFGRAIGEAVGNIIFLSDQDDKWHAEKITTIMTAFCTDPRTTLVLSNRKMIDANGRPLSQILKENGKFSPGVFPNLIRNRYQGSTMAFRREILEAVLPFPADIPMHDSWIGMVNALIGRAVYLPDRLVDYRRHESNVTVGRHGRIDHMVAQRWALTRNLVCRMGTLARVRRKLKQRVASKGEACVDENQLTIPNPMSPPHRAVVFAPFFCADGPASRPRFVGSVLAEIMPVDVVTSDFDHGEKTKRDHRTCSPFEHVTYLQARPYYSNTGVARLVSHLLFSFRVAAYFRRNRDKYDVVYATVPLNVLAWLVFTLAGPKTKMIDVVDIWPDVLPFPPLTRTILAPVFAVWKWFFKSAVAKADMVMGVSDEFTNEAACYAKDAAEVKRFYIGHQRLESAIEKQPVFTIAYIGNIGHLYDFETLLDVLSDSELRDCMQLFVIGQGDREEWLAGELQRRRIKHRMFGAVFEAHRLGDILRSCHLGFNGYINTSAAFSYKATTYCAAGLPLVNSMKGDLQRLVTNQGLGENYEGGDRRQLKDCLLRLYRNGTTTISANCERFFASQLEGEKIASEMKTFFARNLIGARVSPDEGVSCASPRR